MLLTRLRLKLFLDGRGRPLGQIAPRIVFSRPLANSGTTAWLLQVGGVPLVIVRARVQLSQVAVDLRALRRLQQFFLLLQLPFLDARHILRQVDVALAYRLSFIKIYTIG